MVGQSLFDSRSKFESLHLPCIARNVTTPRLVFSNMAPPRLIDRLTRSSRYCFVSLTGGYERLPCHAKLQNTMIFFDYAWHQSIASLGQWALMRWPTRSHCKIWLDPRERYHVKSKSCALYTLHAAIGSQTLVSPFRDGRPSQKASYLEVYQLRLPGVVGVSRRDYRNSRKSRHRKRKVYSKFSTFLIYLISRPLSYITARFAMRTPLLKRIHPVAVPRVLGRRMQYPPT